MSWWKRILRRDRVERAGLQAGKRLAAGDRVVMRGRGLGTVVEAQLENNRPFVSVRLDSGANLHVAAEDAPAIIQPLWSKEQAERLVARALEPAHPDPRPLDQRAAAFSLAISQGTFEEQIDLVRRFYAGPPAQSFTERRWSALLDKSIIDPLAQALDMDPRALTKRIRAAQKNAALPPQTPDSDHPTRPVPVYDQAAPKFGGFDYLGSFTCGPALAVGDLTTLAAQGDSRGGGSGSGARPGDISGRPAVCVVDTPAGRWHAYAIIDDEDAVVAGMLALHASASDVVAEAIRDTTVETKLTIDSASMVIMDADQRDDPNTSEALHLRVGRAEALAWGCSCATGHGGGVFSLRLARIDGHVRLINVRFVDDV